MKEKLKPASVKHLGPRHARRRLWLRVVTKEQRSWLFCYQRLGKAREMGLGSFPDVSLAKARDKTQAAREDLANDIDPIDHREAEATEQAHTTTFAAASRSSEWLADCPSAARNAERSDCRAVRASCDR